MSGILLAVFLGCSLENVHGSSSNSFNAAFSASVLATITDLLQTPWSPVSTVASKFSTMDSPLGQNETQDFIWHLFRPFAEGSIFILDALYVGLQDSGAFVGFTRTPRFPQRPVSLYHVPSHHHACPGVDPPCLSRYDNATDPIRGVRTGPPSATSQFNFTHRPVRRLPAFSCLFPSGQEPPPSLLCESTILTA